VYFWKVYHTADAETCFPDFLMEMDTLMQAVRKSDSTTMKALQQMIDTSDNFLLDVDVDINEKDNEVYFIFDNFIFIFNAQANTLLHHAYCSSFYTTNGQPFCWQDRLCHQTKGGSYVSYVQLLVESGADLSAKNNQRLTPLMYALQQGGKTQDKNAHSVL
jgi:hypothetical protein